MVLRLMPCLQLLYQLNKTCSENTFCWHTTCFLEVIQLCGGGCGWLGCEWKYLSHFLEVEALSKIWFFKIVVFLMISKNKHFLFSNETLSGIIVRIYCKSSIPWGVFCS